MHIVFIYPSMAEKETYRTKKRKGKIKTWCLEPLTIAALKGITPKNHQTTFFDDRIEDIDYQINCDLVAITCETFTAKRAYEIATIFHKNGKTVVMGGFHPSLCPDEALEYCNSVLIGEGEYLWPKMISDFELDKLGNIYNQKDRVEPKDIKADKSIFEGKSYFPFSLVETGRGCNYSCEFCVVSEFYKKCYLRRPLEHIIEEVKRSKHKRILFVDDNIVAHIPSAKELFKALIPLKIKWVCQTSVVIGNDPELLNLMKKSGCIGGLVGFESLNKENLLFMKKHQNLAIHKHDDIVNNIYKYKLKIYASFVIGYDADDAEVIEKTLNYAIEKGFFIANFYQLTPFPGTALYERFKLEKRLISDKWWLDKDFTYGDLVFKPARTTAAEMKALCETAKENFYSYGSIFRRVLKFRINRSSLFSLILFFAVNLLTRKEMYKRKNRKLGRSL